MSSSGFVPPTDSSLALFGSGVIITSLSFAASGVIATSLQAVSEPAAEHRCSAECTAAAAVTN